MQLVANLFFLSFFVFILGLEAIWRGKWPRLEHYNDLPDLFCHPVIGDGGEGTIFFKDWQLDNGELDFFSAAG